MEGFLGRSSQVNDLVRLQDQFLLELLSVLLDKESLQTRRLPAPKMSVVFVN